MKTVTAACVFYRGEHYDYRASVGHKLFLVTNLIRREVEQRMAEHGLTDAQWKPLWILKDGRATTAFELAREMDVDAGAITRLVDRLAAKGLVERLRSEEDRRVVHLRLTADGKDAAEQVPHVLAQANNDLLRGFSDAEWRQLGALLDRLAANAATQADAVEPTTTTTTTTKR